MNTGQSGGLSSEVPSLTEQVIGAVIAHSIKWGTAWFGLIFLGSVFGAIGHTIWPDSSSIVVYAISTAVGLAVGLIAHMRGGWW